MIGLVQTALKEMMRLQSSKSSAGPLLVWEIVRSSLVGRGLMAVNTGPYLGLRVTTYSEQGWNCNSLRDINSIELFYSHRRITQGSGSELFLHSSSVRSWSDNNPAHCPAHHKEDKKLKYFYRLQIFFALMLFEPARQSKADMNNSNSRP